MLQKLTPKFIVFFFFSVIFLIWLGFSGLINNFLHLLNGTKLNTKHYTIEFKKGHWALAMDTKEHYEVVGKDDYLFVQIFKNPEQIDLQNILNSCISLNESKITNHIKMYVCDDPTNVFIYFQSDSKKFLALSKLNQVFTKKIENEYKILLNSYKKR